MQTATLRLDEEDYWRLVTGLEFMVSRYDHLNPYFLDIKREDLVDIASRFPPTAPAGGVTLTRRDLAQLRHLSIVLEGLAQDYSLGVTEEEYFALSEKIDAVHQAARNRPEQGG